jgi:hypothetical protein
LKKLLIIIFLLLGIGFSNEYLAQSGGRKKERRNQRKLSFRRKRSAGNADEFARGGRPKNIFARLFNKRRPALKARSSPPDKSRYNDNSKLFSRYRTKGKQYNTQVLAKRNADRARKRSHGNKSFSRKKY